MIWKVIILGLAFLKEQLTQKNDLLALMSFQTYKTFVCL